MRYSRKSASGGRIRRRKSGSKHRRSIRKPHRSRSIRKSRRRRSTNNSRRRRSKQKSRRSKTRLSKSRRFSRLSKNAQQNLEIGAVVGGGAGLSGYGIYRGVKAVGGAAKSGADSVNQSLKASGKRFGELFSQNQGVEAKGASKPPSPKVETKAAKVDAAADVEETDPTLKKPEDPAPEGEAPPAGGDVPADNPVEPAPAPEPTAPDPEPTAPPVETAGTTFEDTMEAAARQPPEAAVNILEDGIEHVAADAAKG